jgi:O-glycosyl hydrolase
MTIVYVVLAICIRCGAAEHKDVIDLTNKHQVIENFGASDAWTMQKIGAWSEESKNKVADLLFTTDKGIGLSLWRFNIGGGINHQTIRNPWRTVETFETDQGKYDWTKQANELWFARAARDRGVPFLLGFVNSPPGRMTKNGLTNSGSDVTSTTNLKEGFEKQYATYLCDIVQHFGELPDAKERLRFDYLSPVNEPMVEWTSGQEGNRASDEDIKRIILALHEEIEARKMGVKIRTPESPAVPALWQIDKKTTDRWHAEYGDYLKFFLGDSQLAPILDKTVCYHDYSSFEGAAVEKDHARLGQEMLKYPGCTLWMSEICILHPRRDLSINMALDVAKLIHADLALAGASAWQWWLAVSDGNYKDGLLYTNWHKEGDEESIIPSKTFWAMGNFSRFIRPGMRRVELTGGGHGFEGLLGSAYLDEKSAKVVMVYINLGKEAEKVSWTFKGAGPKGFTPYVTSEDSDLKKEDEVSSDGAEIPGRSIVTFVGE